MIERVKGIRITGRCFQTDSTLLFFQKPNDRISIVYGKNGSGKSTISEGIASISSGAISSAASDLSVSFIDANLEEIPVESGTRVFVFNEKYIDENVKIDDDGLGTIVLFGDQVDLQAEIDRQEAKIKSISDEVERATIEYAKYQERSNPLCPAYHQGRIITILKQDGSWADIDSKIKGNKIKSQVTEATVKEIGELAVEETLDELARAFDKTYSLLSKISDSSISYPNPIDQIVIDDGWESSVLSILARKIDEPVLSEREQQILAAIQSGAQERIESAQKVFCQEQTRICPYCYQPVSEHYKHDLVESINKVLNKDVDDHKAEISAIRFPVLSVDLASVESLDEELVKDAVHQLDVCKSLLRQYQDYSEQKESNVYTPILIEANGFTKEIEKLNIVLSALESKRVEFNDFAKKRASIVKKLISINKAIAHIKIEKLYKDYSKQEKDKASTYQKLSVQQNALGREKERLNNLQQQKANIRLAIENINNSLDYVFLSQGRLSIELRNDKYYLKSNGADVLPKKVSQGERNIIALCYFFTQILSNQEVGKLYQNETLTIIDDPISSFDFENKIGITSLLRFQTDRIIKGNVNSKLLVMSHDLETVFALRKAFEEICKSTKGIADKPETTFSHLELLNLKLVELKKRHNEYENLVKRIYHFANGDAIEDSLVIGNEMRRVLEAFSSFTYQKSIEMVSCDSNVLAALGNFSLFFENLMYRLVLHGESHYEEQIYSIHDGYNFYQFISEEEKIKTAKSILCFMYLLNPHHVIAYLQVESGAIESIKQWVKTIPDNQSFEIAEKASGRIIPLYYLPISAGVGKDCFDGISSDDFETDNGDCDFALKVSGNSMEPQIPDESVVLVKKQETIDDGVTGAFYYNGKVYCKYIHHENEKAYLCSNNSIYPPILLREDDDVYLYGVIVEVITP